MENGPDQVLCDPKLGSADLVSLRLYPEVLFDQDRLSILAAINPGVGPQRMEGDLKALDTSGRQLWEKPLVLERQSQLQRFSILVGAGPRMTMRCSLYPGLRDGLGRTVPTWNIGTERLEKTAFSFPHWPPGDSRSPPDLDPGLSAGTWPVGYRLDRPQILEMEGKVEAELGAGRTRQLYRRSGNLSFSRPGDLCRFPRDQRLRSARSDQGRGVDPGRSSYPAAGDLTGKPSVSIPVVTLKGG